MSGKGKEVDCCGEDGVSRRQPGRKHRRRPRREEVTEKGKAEEYYWEDGVAYLVVGGKHEMTRRELIEYTNKVAESEGYDVHIDSNILPFQGGIVPVVPHNDYYRGLLNFMANLALGKYNEEQGTQLEFYAFQKANTGCATGGFKYYITFSVVDWDDYANPIKVFQAQVVLLYQKGQYRVDQIRPKPTSA